LHEAVLASSATCSGKTMLHGLWPEFAYGSGPWNTPDRVRDTELRDKRV
jgi:hypothetical protein